MPSINIKKLFIHNKKSYIYIKKSFIDIDKCSFSTLAFHGL